MLSLLYSVCIAFFVVYFSEGEVKKMKNLFTVYNQRLAGYLMMNGFPLIKLTENRQTGKNDFIFVNVPMLQDYIKKWQTEKTETKK